ncbi:MAG: methylmalonyl Co-A mutase-associated GTPase MeaB [Planctomycetota bacterium]|nr:MAG: methylmalonyl Co-A mutase-associated GTPase MeaB [Planctomycetota bacterium]
MERSLDQLVSEARGGGPRSQRAAARLMSVMTDQPHRLAELLAGSRDWPQPRLVLGITGAPGSGKSTLADHVVAELRALDPRRKVGVVAVDPSSPFTGGALLGDRVRMMRHATDSMVYIRSLASRGHLGGLALGAKGVVRVMGLVGCDIVVVETVGVGQSEVEIAQNADVVVVVLAPGQGDSIQMLKAGLMEAGDLFVVNKADKPDAAQLQQQLLAMLERSRTARLDLAHGASEPLVCHGPQLQGPGGPIDIQQDRPPPPMDFDEETPGVFLCSAANHQGIKEFVAALEELTTRQAALWQARRQEQAVEEIRQAVLEEVRRRVSHVLQLNGNGENQIRRILAGETTLNELVDWLMDVAASGTNAKSPAASDAKSHLRTEAAGRAEFA